MPLEREATQGQVYDRIEERRTFIAKRKYIKSKRSDRSERAPARTSNRVSENWPRVLLEGEFFLISLFQIM